MNDKMYLTPENWKNVSFEFLNDSGMIKNWLIRTFTIHYRHILQYWTEKHFEEFESKGNKYLLSKRNKNIYKICLNYYHKAIKRTHKLKRDISDIEIRIYFDFDNTIPPIVKYCKSQNIDFNKVLNNIILNQISKNILGKKLHKYLSENNVKLKFKFYILSASGNKEGIKEFLDKNKISEIFSDLYICGGEQNKINKMKKILLQTDKNFIPILIDDSLKICKIISMLSCFCFHFEYKKNKIKIKFKSENF